MGLRSLIACIIAALSLGPIPAQSDFFPLTDGILSEYQRVPDHFGVVTVHFAGTAEIGGTTTRVQWSSDERRQFWSESGDGDKLLHGTAFRDEVPLTFSPPIPYLDQPLHVGKTWSVATVDSDGLQVHFDFEVIAYGPVTVPAGTFDAFTIRHILKVPDGVASENVVGTKPATSFYSSANQVTDRSYAMDVGLVRSMSHGFGIVLKSQSTIGTQDATWTAVRQMYR